MRATICLTLPTNRACADTLVALLAEARYAADTFSVTVELLVLDSCEPVVFAEHARVLAAGADLANVVVRHLDEAAQREFLRRVITVSGVAKPELMLELMLPAEPSYGACTNRAFLIAAALGCDSVHRRDSDSRYQVHDGETVFPIHHELLSLGKPAADATVSENALDPSLADLPVVLVGGSFIGELSVDIADIRHRDPQAYHDIVGLWAPVDWSGERKRELVAESFTGAGTAPFTGDHSTLTVVDPMRVDMCNIAFHQVQEDVPLLPATNTIGSDYFLLHLVYHAGLPGVLHNRNIINFYTPERRSDSGFRAYHLRLVKFFLSMHYLNAIYAGLAEAALLGADLRVRPDAVVELARASATLPQEDNVHRLEELDRSYRRLGGRYAEFADVLAEQRARLLDEARRDIEDFALLTESWRRLVDSARVTGLAEPQR